MHIIHTVPSVAEEASGVSYSSIRLCESLINLSHQATLATLGPNSSDSQSAFLRSFPLGFGPRRLGRSPKMKHWLYSQAAAHAADVIHNHSIWMMPNVYPGNAAGRYNIPYIVSPRGTLSEWAMQNGSPVKRIFWPMLQRPALSAVTCFHATAELEYEDIRRMGFRQPTAIIPNGIDIPDLMNEKQNRVRTLLFLGRIHPKKGLDMLLPAWQAIQDRFPEWRLNIVGPDNSRYAKSMHRLSAELSLQRIEFNGPLYGLQKIRAYQEADLFILPTYSENFGNCVAEALASGTPAVVTKGAPWEGLSSHDCGWWTDIGVDPLVACIENALNRSRNELKAMGERGRNWMTADYSWEQVAKKMVAVYYWACKGAPKPDCVVE